MVEPRTLAAALSLAALAQAQDVSALVRAGEEMVRAGKPRDAVASLDDAVAKAPADGAARYWRGRCRSALGDHLGAWFDFTTALQGDPENARLFFHRGLAASALGSTEHARKDLESATLLEKDDGARAAAHAWLGFVQVAAGQDAAALKSFEKVHELDPRGQERARLWRYWLQARAGSLPQDARAELPEKGFHGSLGKTLLGERTENELLRDVPAGKVDADGIRTRRAEAAFYLGVRELLIKRVHKAREHFKEVLVHGEPAMPEWHVALRLSRR